MTPDRNDHKRLPSLRSMIEDLTQELREMDSYGSYPASGMIFAGGGSTSGQTDAVGNVVVKKERLRKRLEELHKMYLDEYDSRLDELESIPDAETRAIMWWRNLHGLDWKQVAQQIGTGYSEDCVKQRASRYLRSRARAKEGSNERQGVS